MQVLEKLNLPDLNKFFAQEKDVAFAVLFGSYALEKQNANSDVDLAICLNLPDLLQRAKKRHILIAKLLHFLKKEVDLVILNDVQDNFLLSEILKTGKLIYCQDEGAYFDFKTKIQHRVSDFLTHYYYVNGRKDFGENPKN